MALFSYGMQADRGAKQDQLLPHAHALPQPLPQQLQQQFTPGSTDQHSISFARRCLTSSFVA